jgi:glycerol-3-phosphate acyltransferase PlsX
VLDSGANPEVNATQLYQFAVMGAIASEALLGASNPRVGLLSIGEEKGKGRAIEKAAFDLMDASQLNFIGNVEGRDVGTDRVDVIVTDGFTGNVFLKTTEGTARLVLSYLAEELAGLSDAARAEAMPALQRVADMLDYETYGGAHLLGVNGAVVISHGSSTRKSIANALVMARDAVETDIASRIREQLA